MTLQDLGNLGEFIGSFAVVITLVYLAIQIRHNTRASRTESLNTALGVHVKQIAQLTATNEDSELFRKFADDFHALSANEKGRIQAMMLARIASFNQVIRLHASGMLDDDEFEAMQGTFISILRTAGGRDWWGAYKHMVPRGLDDYVTNALNDPNIKRKPYNEELPWLFEDG